MNYNTYLPQKKIGELPANFEFSEEDELYYGAPLCNIFHYRTGAAIVAILDALIMLGWSVVFSYLYYDLHIIGKWTFMVEVIVLAHSLLTSVLVIVGLIQGNANLMLVKGAFFHARFYSLLVMASTTIVVMSVGLELTNYAFGKVIDVSYMERAVGSIWPFNLSVVMFFFAVLDKWMGIVIQGAYEFYMDREFFASNPIQIGLNEIDKQGLRRH